MESGVENVVLGDLQRVLSIARSKHGYLLNDRTASLERIFQSFALLRSKLFRTENVLEMDPTTLMQPFLDLIRHERTSSQLTRAALEGVENFLQNWELVMAPWPSTTLASTAPTTPSVASSTASLAGSMSISVPNSATATVSVSPVDALAHQTLSDTVSEIVDAVVQCRFQETDQESDRRVILMVVQVLKAIVTTRWVTFLSDHSMWQLVESLYGLSRSSLREPYMTTTLRSSSTNVLRQTLRAIFQKDAIYDANGVTLGFGLPCAVKIVGFLCQKLHHPQFQPKGGSVANAASNGSATGVFSRRDVYLSFNLLLVVLSTSKHRLAQVPSLMIFIKDDVCSAILRYSRLGVTGDHSILLVCLQMIRLLWCHCRLLLKMQLEAILSTVYVQTLQWILSHLEMHNQNASNGSMNGSALLSSSSNPGMAPTPSKSSLLSNGSFVTSANCMETIDEFTGQVVQLEKLFVASHEILECLVDLVAQPTFVPDLYVNYDCDGNRCDLTHTICKLLADVVVKSHDTCRETHDENHFHWAQAMGETALRALFNALYVLYHRTQRNSALSADPTANSTPPTPTVTPPSSAWNLKRIVRNPSSSELAIDFNGAMVGFETAEQLFVKRQRKKKFQFGIQEFNRKPLAGIKYLQSHGFLPTPLDAASLASFLRSLPSGLSKKAVGVYLGAVGKDVQPFEKKDVHEADTMQFHREVLAQFVSSFNFDERGVLESLRIFLASFRLPGEAQQIDRILNQFATQVYAQSRDRTLFASVDVAYLLCFALIMLNTDLHNANIRPEKKMKLEDFIKYNTFYGEDVSGTQRLPESFLEELYTSIAQEQIQTLEEASSSSNPDADGSGIAAVVGVTMDRWKDLLYQAERNPNESLFIVHQDIVMAHSTPSSSRSNSARHFAFGKDGSEVEVDVEAEEDDEEGEMETLRNKLGSQYDQLIFEVLYEHLMVAFGSVFDQYVVAHDRHGAGHSGSHSNAAARSLMTYLPEKAMLQLACNGFVLNAAVASHLELVEMFNQVFRTICDYTTLFPSEKYPVGSYLNAFGSSGDRGGADAHAQALKQFCTNTSAPLATAAMLKLVNTCAHSLQRGGWRSFLRCLSSLREFRALPLTLGHAQQPLLNGEERRHFDDLILKEIESFELAKAQAEAERKARNPGANEGSGAFFSGVAWLMSALDQSLSSSTGADKKKRLGGRLMHKKKRGEELDGEAEEEVDPAYDVHDLMDFVESTGDADEMDTGKNRVRKRLSSNTTSSTSTGLRTGSDSATFGTPEWIARTLEPYRLESFLVETSKLPHGALQELLLALDEEISISLSRSSRGSSVSNSEVVDGSSEPNDDEDKAVVMVEKVAPSHHMLSPGGTLFCAHLLSQIVYLNLVAMVSSSSNSMAGATAVGALRVGGNGVAGGSNDVFQVNAYHQVVTFLQRHLTMIFGSLRPLLVSHEEVNGMKYELGAKLLDKTLLCMFSSLEQLFRMHNVPLALKSAENEQFVLNCLKCLMEMDGNVLEMVLTQVVSGLDRMLGCNMEVINANEQWMTFLYLVELSVQDGFASHYGFAIVEKIVAWRLKTINRRASVAPNAGNGTMTLPPKASHNLANANNSTQPSPIKQLDLFTICLRFALERDFVHRERALQLLETICCELDDTEQDDTAQTEPFKTHLRMAGGFMLTCLHHYQGDDQLKGVQVLESMLHHIASREEEDGKRPRKMPMGWPFWMEVLRFGLVRIAAELFAHFDFALEKKYAFVLPTKEQKAQVALFYYETNDFETFFAQQQRERERDNSLDVVDERTDLDLADHHDVASQQQQKRSPLSRLPRTSSGSMGGASDVPERRMRRNSWREPPELRSLLIVLQLMSWVVCEQFKELLASPSVFELWHSIVEVFVGALQSTNQMGKEDAAISNVALERRALLAAHEDILEHFKSICRRLWKQQELLTKVSRLHGEETKENEEEEEKDEDTTQIPQQMIQILKQSIDSKRETPSHDGDLLYELFPSFAPDASSTDDEVMKSPSETEAGGDEEAHEHDEVGDEEEVTSASLRLQGKMVIEPVPSSPLMVQPTNESVGHVDSANSNDNDSENGAEDDESTDRTTN